MRLGDNIFEQLRSDLLILVVGMNLDLADFNFVGALEQLNHSDLGSANYYQRNLTFLPAFVTVALVALLVPRSEGHYEQIMVGGASKFLKPYTIRFRRVFKVVDHSDSAQ